MISEAARSLLERLARNYEAMAEQTESEAAQRERKEQDAG